jgi:sterol desaturase/sphingolipid hydroxylase (fatty acid hydroxylase superfamily)
VFPVDERRAVRRRARNLGDMVLGSRRARADGFVEYTGAWWKLALPLPILAVHLAVVASLCVWARLREPARWSALAAGVGLGFVLWTAFEYALHRWLLHNTTVPVLKRWFWQALHKEHHGYRAMKDPDHHGVHLAITFPLVVVIVSVVWGCGGGAFALAVTAGWVFGYCAYEGLHWLFHAGEPGEGFGRLPWIRRLWELHAVHHLHRADVNYGFVTSVWDALLGTRATKPESDPAAR